MIACVKSFSRTFLNLECLFDFKPQNLVGHIGKAIENKRTFIEQNGGQTIIYRSPVAMRQRICMHLLGEKIDFPALIVVSILLSACGGGGNSGTATGTNAAGFAYAANSGDSTISQYTIDANGALSPIGTIASGANPNSVTIHPAGKFVYVANSGYQVISQYTISAGGGLVPMSPATVPSGSPGSAPVSIAVDPSGKYAYAANSLSDDVAQFTINLTSGILTPMTTATVTPCSPTPALRTRTLACLHRRRLQEPVRLCGKPY